MSKFIKSRYFRYTDALINSFVTINLNIAIYMYHHSNFFKKSVEFNGNHTFFLKKIIK